MSLYLEENNLIFNKFLKDYFYNCFRDGGFDKQLELIISPKCNLACKICYINKYRSQIYPDSVYNTENIRRNLKILLEFLYSEKLHPSIDIFSGEPFAQNIGFECIDIILDFYKDKKNELKPAFISIPTNFTFLCSDDLTKRVNKILSDFNDIGIKVLLSASFDGKLIEDNRPYCGDIDIPINVLRNDAYYNKVFEFIKNNNCGIHPMVDSRHIDKWKENFIWFQDMMQKYEISWDEIYLLQVRNAEWSRDEVRCFYDFIKFLIKFAFDKCNYNKKDFLYFLLESKGKHGFNILSECFSQVGRGMSCGIQNNFPIRLSDMKVFPCHRLMYPELEIGEIKSIDGSLEFDTKNVSLGLSTYACSHKMFPVCCRCPINDICIGGCLGSQYENTKSMYTPIPTVCLNFYGLIKGVQDGLKEIGVYYDVISRIDKNRASQFTYVEGVNIDELC